MATVVLLMQILQEEIFDKVNKWYGNQLIVALRITPRYALTTITVLNKLWCTSGKPINFISDKKLLKEQFDKKKILNDQFNIPTYSSFITNQLIYWSVVFFLITPPLQRKGIYHFTFVCLPVSFSVIKMFVAFSSATVHYRCLTF